MHSRTPSSALALIAALVVTPTMMLACADFSRGEPSPGADAGAVSTDGGAPGSVDGGVALGFASDVHPLLLSSCQSCHSSGGNAGNTEFILIGDADADYTAVVAIIDESSPAQSRLLAKASGTGHVGGAVFPADSTEYGIILQWIEQGALP